MIFFLSACVGLTFILKYGTILKWMREPLIKLHPKIKELFGCSLCLGFWSGVLIGLYSWYFCHFDMEAVLFPFASAGLSWFFDSLIKVIQLQQIKSERDLK